MSEHLTAYLGHLERLHALQMEGKGSQRRAGALRTAMRQLRELLTPTERLAADRRGLELNREYRAWLATQPEEPPEREPTPPPPGPTARPTDALPGSAAKVEAMARRRRRGLPVNAPADVDEDPERGLQALAGRNGALAGGNVGEVVSEKKTSAIVTSRLVRIGFAHRLYEARRQRGWAQLTLAAKAGLTQQTVSLSRAQRAKPTLDTAKRLAAALGLRWEELLGEARAV